MKRRLIFRIITVALTLALLVAALPLSSVLAATVQITPPTGTVGSFATVTGTGFTPAVANFL
ncbi:MAG: hypothetical protein ABUK06_04860, partial [Dehalococcoidales bacterium]